MCLSNDKKQMKLLAIIQRRTFVMTMLSYTMVVILLISASVVVVFTYYLFPTTAYSQVEASLSQSSTPLYKNIAGNGEPQSKVIEASGHFANNQKSNKGMNMNGMTM
jgi:hypothetical protein